MKSRLLAIPIILLSMLVLSACSAAKKPAPPQNQTIIVPEVSRVSFETLDLKAAPKVVRDIAVILKDQDSGTWAQIGNKAYFIVGGGERAKNYDITVDEILQRVPEQGFTWIDVKLKYKKKSQPASTEPVFTVASANMTKSPNGVGFTFTGPESQSPAVNTPPAAKAPAPAPAPIRKETGATLEQPVTNQEITSPAKIRGTVTAQGQKRIRLSTRGGQIIKEEGLSTGSGGAFETSLSYSPPDMAVPGQIAIIEVSGSEEKILARVPVIIK